MKKPVMLLLLLAVSSISRIAISQVPRYEITGNIEGAEGISFVLQKVSDGKIVYFDTTVVSNGIFKITGGSVRYPERVSLVTMDKQKGVTFFLENSRITITGKLDSLSNARITGSKSNDEYSVFIKSIRPLSEKQAQLKKEYDAANKAIMEEIKAVQKDFILKNPASYVSPVLLNNLIKELKPTEIETIMNAMDPNVANSPLMTEIKTRSAAMISVFPGKKHPVSP